MTTKFCENCKFYEPSELGWEFAKCNAPQNIEGENLIVAETKKNQRRWIFCETQREDCLLISLMVRSCGKIGRWYQHKD